jgi:type II secretory pathway component GspD/PulD (secretin)
MVDIRYMGRNIFIILLGLAVFLTYQPLSYAQEETEEVSEESFVDQDYVEDEDSQESEYVEAVAVDGEEISLDLKGVDVGDLFRILSIKTNKTIVPSKNVTGRINVFLNKVTFEDALDVILISQGYSVDKKEHVYFIMTSSEYKAMYGREYIENRKLKTFRLQYADPESVFATLSEIKSDIGKIITDSATGYMIIIDIPEKLELMEETINDLDRPLSSAIFDINYSDVDGLKTSLGEIMTPNAGEVIVDERSSKVFVTDLPEKLQELGKMVAAFDEESRQVFIEVEILEITLTDQFQRGVNWEKVFNERNFNKLDLVGSFAASSLATYQQVSVGTISRDNYTFLIQYLQSHTDVKILSRPRIAVVNKEEASILVGSREAYVSQTQSQAESTTVTSEAVEFIDVGVKLNVVPTINNEGFVTMSIKPEISSVRDTLVTSLNSQIPIVDTSEAETVVKVKDGATIMIAGLIKDDHRNTVTGIPLLSRIPVIGMLFGNRDRLIRKTETVVFITPHLIRGDEAVAGSEIEKHVPSEIMPYDMKDHLILNELENIGIDSTPALMEMLVTKKSKEGLTPKDLEEKMKGFRE